MAGNRVRRAALFIAAGSALWLSTPALGVIVQAQQVAASVSAPAHDVPRVTIDVEGVSLSKVLHTIVQQAGLVAMYDATLIPSTVRVTLHVRQIPVDDAFQRVLQGTGLIAQIYAKGQVVIMRGTDTLAAAGTIEGTVLDGATKRPLRGASISLDGAKPVATSGEDGTFRVTQLSPGSHRLTVRRLGYQLYTQSIVIQDDRVTTVSVMLAPAAIKLNEVVTTAIGQQRRLEVGNVIAHLNADSIAKTAPVTNLTDLLSARAPGVQVIESSGLVGAGASIRIRGISSMALSSDPIIIVDGVRQDNTPGGKRFSGLFGNGSSPSRINDIDVSQIETIDILKGPAASTEYGTDAANGVIVIKTKRGRTGTPRWHVSGEHGWSEIPTGFPDFYYSYGHTTDGTNLPLPCPLSSPLYRNQSDGTCAVDSVVHDNPLNHRGTSIYGTGGRDKVNVDVSGGSDAIQYFVGGGTSHELGTTRLPQVFHTQALALGFPSSVLDPNTQSQQSARANIDVHLSEATELTVNGSYFSTRQSQPFSSGLSITSVTYPVVLDSAHYYGYGDGFRAPLYSLGIQSNESTRGMTGGASLDWRPVPWFSGHVTGGLNHAAQRSGTIMPAAVYVFAQNRPDNGMMSLANATTDVTSADGRGSFALPLTATVRSVTSIGLQIAKTKTQGLTALATNIMAANPTLNGVPNPTVMQDGTGSATVGGYAEEQIGIADRLFVTGALRLDGASGFGGDYHTTVYPKLSASWLAVDRDGTTVRVRSAFGVSGVQPNNGASLQLYQPQVVYVDGNEVSSSMLTGPGNPDLRPERSREMEGGIDIGMLHTRVNLELTAYTKHTKDALINRSLGLTLNNWSWQENLGDVLNTGVEATLQASPIQTDAVTWNFTLNASHNRNKLQRLAPDVIGVDVAGNQRFVVGYPLYGYWAPRATFEDANHDGIITPSEIQIADTAMYIGTNLPKVETSLASQIDLFHGALAIGTLFDSRWGDIVQNSSKDFGGLSLYEQNDSSAPPWQQARAIAWRMRFGPTSLNFEKGWFVRFRELSLTYTPPASWLRRLGGHTVSVTTAVRNLGLWSHYSGADPEVSSAGAFYNTNTSRYEPSAELRTDNGTVPLPRTWVVRCNIGL